jgi:hypothetical protein
MDFRPLDDADRIALRSALRRNATEGVALLMNGDTSFAGTSLAELPDDEVISAVRSVPCHY